MRQLGALLAAAAMIVAAVLVNGVIHDADGTDGAASAADAPVVKVRVVCASEFEEVCDALAADPDVGAVATFETQRPGDTATAISESSPTFDIWLTSQPWPGIAAARSDGNAGLGEPGEPLASSRLGLVAEVQRTRAIGRTCDLTGMGADCVFGVSGTAFDALGVAGDSTPAKFGIAPTSQTAGVLALAAMAQARFGGNGFDITDIDIDVEFRSWLSRLETTSVASDALVDQLLTIPRFNVAVDLNVHHQLEGAASADEYQVLDFGPRADAVVVPVATADGAAAIDKLGRTRLVDALVAGGWRLPDGTEFTLPDPAVLDALATRWDA